MSQSHEESLKAWQANAKFWDDFMKDNSNEFHRRVVRPRVNELLQPQSDDYILDIACGNGNYSMFLAKQGIKVVAFDYSDKMIALAKKRRAQYLDRIEFHVCDATDENSLMSLKKARKYTKAVSNMAIMDISRIDVLFKCVNNLLADNGTFVFATSHPCFDTLTKKYKTAHSYYGEAIKGQPTLQCYYHRSLEDIFNVCFKNGFVIDGFYEECYNDLEKPVVIIARVRKIK